MRVGLSTCGRYICEKIFREYSCAGITDMEIDNGNQTSSELEYKQVYTWSKQYGVNLWSYHLPFEPRTNIDLSKKELRENAIDLFSELIKRGADIGIDKFVIHPSSEPIVDDARNEQMKCTKESLAELGEIAKQCGAMIAVENLPRTCLGKNSEEILELINVHPNLRVCFDTNHLLEEDIHTFIRNVGEKIITIHVSDFDFINERHWLPGEGDIDWELVVLTLKEVGYRGPWLYEIGLNPPPTIERRMLELNDFVDNANALFMQKKPKVIGKRKENLGLWGVIERE